MKTVVVTWMDRTQETYICEETRLDWGVLYLVPPSTGYPPQPRRVIPLNNVKIFTEEK